MFDQPVDVQPMDNWRFVRTLQARGVMLIATLAFSVTPVAAQHVVWSGTLTAQVHESGTFVGYHPGVDLGDLEPLDFEFQGQPYSMHTLVQTLTGDDIDPADEGKVNLRFNPGAPLTDLETMIFTVNGETLTAIRHSSANRSYIQFAAPEWRWEDGQVVQLELSTSLTPVPTLPVAAIWLLLAALVVRGYR